MEYRKEIDGLRALAVIPVILFHAGFKAFSGGYVGVDIFFVISGYLITAIIINDLEKSHFSIINFYEKRARRILPALFVVLLICLPAAWVWLTPNEMKGFSSSLVAVSVFASNIYFWHASDYFGRSAELLPLLHTWSLAVEEQFYLFFPLILLFTWKFGRLFFTIILCILALASFVFAQVSSSKYPVAGFFLPLTRVWELLIGALIALHFSKNIPPVNSASKYYEIGGMLGILLIGYGIYSFSANTPYPSFYTLAPTMGTALVIICANKSNFAGWLLSRDLLVGLGIISYSTYLWHQPLFAFVRIITFNNISYPVMTGLTITSIFLGFFTWRFVERPFRSREKINRIHFFIYSGMFIILFISLGLGGRLLTNGYEFRFSENDIKIFSYENYPYKKIYREGECFLEFPDNKFTDFSSECASQIDSDSALIWGDSHAAALSAGLKTIRGNIVEYAIGACPPILETRFKTRPHCLENNNFVASEVGRIKPKLLFLHAFWGQYPEEDVVPNLRKTLSYINKVSPKTNIVIVGGVPKWDYPLPQTLWRNKIILNTPHDLEISNLDKIKSLDIKLAKISREYDATFMSALDKLCVNDRCLAVTLHSSIYEPTAWDDSHLTEAGSIYLANELMKR